MRRDDPGPYNLDALRALAAPAVFELDPAALKATLVSWFEAETGRTLYPMQAEMLLVDMIAYLWSLTHKAGDLAHRQRYASLADEPWLATLGAQPAIETPPLDAAAATTRLRFTLAAAFAFDVIIPAGTRVSAGSAATMFASAGWVRIPAGALTGETPATAATVGAAANGLQPGQVTQLLDPVAGVATVANITVTAGGMDAETPDAYRLRLCNALEKTSIRGQRRGIVEHVAAMSGALIDIQAVRPSPCFVDIYLLLATGVAPAGLNAYVAGELDRLQRDELLPMGDLYTVKAARPLGLRVHFDLVVESDVLGHEAAATAAAINQLREWSSRLSPRVAPEELRKTVKAIAGVINVETTGLDYQTLPPGAFVDVSLCTVTAAARLVEAVQ